MLYRISNPSIMLPGSDRGQQCKRIISSKPEPLAQASRATRAHHQMTAASVRAHPSVPGTRSTWRFGPLHPERTASPFALLKGVLLAGCKTARWPHVEIAHEPRFDPAPFVLLGRSVRSSPRPTPSLQPRLRWHFLGYGARRHPMTTAPLSVGKGAPANRLPYRKQIR